MVKGDIASNSMLFSSASAASYADPYSGFVAQSSGNQTSTATKSDPKPKGLIDLTFSKLLLLFVVGSVIGLILEVIFHAIVFGGYESRAGLVWGPFSPLYGAGAVALTVLLNRMWRHPGIIIFLVAMVVGSAIEFATSLWMELSFGAIAWDYSDTFGNIQGRVNLMFGCMWGILGLAWVRLVMPLMKRGFDLIDWKSAITRTSSVALTLFLSINIVVTVQALDRESARANGVPAASQIDQFYDEHFPSSFMQTHFENMSIYGKVA